VCFWYDKRIKKSFVAGRKAHSQTDNPDYPDYPDNSAIILEPVIIEAYKPVKHIVPRPVAIYGNKYTGVFSNVADLKKNLKNPESYDFKYFRNEEIKKMLSEIKNLDAIIVLYELK
jgi:hypothetical protein